MVEKVQKLYNEITENLNLYLKEHSVYNPDVYQDTPEDKQFPIVIVNLLPYTVEYTTKKYTDELYNYGLEIIVYTMPKGEIARQTIADEITDYIEKFFHDEYRMTVKISKNVANADTSVYRNVIRATCILDTKYRDKLVIYPSMRENF